MDTAIEQTLTPEQKEAVKYSNTLFNYLCTASFDAEIKLPVEDKAKYEKGCAMIREWMDNGSFSREGFFVAFDSEYKSLKKWKLF